MTISLIVAISKNHIIGKDGDLPWHLPKDLKFFSEKTKGHHVLMGRKNFQSIPPKYRPLPYRPNLVVTRNNSFTADGIQVFQHISEAIDFAREKNETELFIIGGGEIYDQCIDIADKMYITHVDAIIEGDTAFPSFNEADWNKTLVLEHESDTVHKYPFKTFEYHKLK